MGQREHQSGFGTILAVEKSPKKVEVCPICDGRGYQVIRYGDVIGGVAQDAHTEMHYCRCQRGGELELLVAQECGKAYESGLQTGRLSSKTNL